MQSLRLVYTAAWMALSLLIISSCEQDSSGESHTATSSPASAAGTNEAAPELVSPDNQPSTSIYQWHAQATPAGETTVVRSGDGRITNESFVHWNNREYRVNSELQLDANGIIVAQTISGVSPFGATVDERFSYIDGQAQWQTRGESGNMQTDEPAFYLATEWGAVASTEALVRAALKNLNGEIAMFPAGTARVEKLLTTQVASDEGTAELSLYAISGINFTPQFAWFSDDLELVALYFGRLGMLPEGWDSAVLQELGRLQAEEEARISAGYATALSHPVSQPVLFANVDVVDVASGELLAGHHVLVEDGRIRQVSSGPINSESALTIDASGKTMIPGLWDMHGHFDLTDGLLNIAGGVTSVRDLGSVHDRIMELTEKFNAGTVIGPTTYRAAMIDQVGPYANRNPAASLEEALQLIDDFAARGYLQIKLYSSIDPAWVPAIAERTHQHGMRLSGHIPAFMSAEQAVRAGYDEIQHINMVFLNFLVGDQGDTRQQIRFTTYGSEGGQLDLQSAEVESFIELLKQNDVVVDPTAAIFDSMMTHVAGDPNPTFAEVIDHLPAGIRREEFNPSFEIGEARLSDWAATAARQGQMIRKLHDSGVQLVAGSDSMPGFTLHRELELYAQAGISNADVLKIATLDSAEVLGVAEETGSIEAGKAADLVLLDGNPLQDISAVRRAVLVMKGQTLFRPDELYPAVGNLSPFVESVKW